MVSGEYLNWKLLPDKGKWFSFRETLGEKEKIERQLY
jgi:hypothetical protein